LEFINGKMEELTQDNGKIIICTEKEFTHGLMVADMKGNMKWIKNMDMEYTNGLTAEFMKEAGLMVNNTGKENICCKMEQ
jgi:hypothetical protein